MHNPKIWLSEAVTRIPQSNIPEQQRYNHTTNPTTKKKHSRGDEWDQINLTELLKCPHKKLYEGQSRFQNIHVLEAKEIRMFLDGQLQFSSLDERIYHEAFVHIPMSLTKSHERILILGGGDGLALREVLKYPDVKHVDLVDIDPEILRIAREVPEIVSLNEQAFYDKRVTAYAEDARTFLQTDKRKYDLIIVDFPDPTDPVLASLYSLEMFQSLGDCLTSNGMIVCQSNSPEDTPIVYWSIGLTMEKAGFYTQGYHTIIPSFGDWGFQLGSKTPLATQLREINVPYRTLPPNLGKLFHFKSQLLSYRAEAIVNRESKPQLDKIFQEEIIKVY
ncbi:spermine/spermidine synthase domain-containing protein [Fredinandcohnia sp. FSL W7-1320]|uniref:spermine/spermidine synthase domain-containing protein n=1 Tax=Fredinandcohnia sp. FSL W7-1320 TaxID=2954540 RepID=UPI0030FDE875